jgi:hypothetical protein
MERDIPPELLKRYFALEVPEVREIVLSLPGPLAGINAVPLFRWRLAEEESKCEQLRAEGFTRMAEKAEDLVACLRQLITLQGDETDDTPGQELDTER